MKKLILLTFIVFSINLNAMNFFGMNGKFWNKANDTEKIYYVYAVFDSLAFHEWKIYNVKLNVKASKKQYIQGIDYIYKDNKNLNIPAVYLIQVVSLQIDGASKRDIELLIQRYRKNFVNFYK